MPENLYYMKKNILSYVLLLVASFAMAQAPQLLNYQAVVRSSSGNPVANGTVVTLRFIIHDQTEAGTVVFTETQKDTANEFGLVSTKIGRVTSLASVNWSGGAKYLEVDLDPNGGTNLVQMGTSQLVSVPLQVTVLQVRPVQPVLQAQQVYKVLLVPVEERQVLRVQMAQPAQLVRLD